MNTSLPLFLSCARGLEPLLAAELQSLGAQSVKERHGGVAGTGSLELAYRACLWSRLASRVLLPLAQAAVATPDELYAAARAIDWPALFGVDTRFAVAVAGRSPAFQHTNFAGLRLKDAIVDTFRDRLGRRPDVDTRQPDIGVHLHLSREHADISLDLSGDSLHRRGYRTASGEAPLRESLASALLLRAGWPEVAARGGALLDPMCGSGTLLIEGAWMAADIAPGLKRAHFGFEHWAGHDPAVWHGIVEEARERRAHGLARMPVLLGRDLDARVLDVARANARRAGLDGHIRFEAGDVVQAAPTAGEPGLLICNPPYGERLGGEAEVIKLYSLLGSTLKSRFGGWRAAVFTGRPDLAPRIGLRADTIHAFYNGDLPCKLLQFQIADGGAEAGDADPAFANRLAKNLRHLDKWARRQQIDCYRVYDADLPEYAVAVDRYASVEGALHLHVQEYAAPASIDAVKAEKRLRQALAALQAQFDLPASQLHFKRRAVQRGSAQYTRQARSGAEFVVSEQGCRLWVNLDDYLDTGLFLDHRPMRLRLRGEAAGKRLLNLFCYTGAVTAQAALGSAATTVSVDLSNTYLRWAQRNLAENGFDARIETHGAVPRAGRGHTLVRADCMAWLEDAAQAGARFDLIFCDPPTFSNSAKVEGVFDVVRDHPLLLRRCMALLARGGTLYFSTNKRRFRLDEAIGVEFQASDISTRTVDEDFRRGAPPHRAWALSAH